MRNAAVATVLVMLAAAVHDGIAFMNMHQKCASFQCSEADRVPVSKIVDFTVNGCGVEVAKVVEQPEMLADCCNWHEACYSICGMKKATCDKRFDKCMRSKCAAVENNPAKESCESGAQMLNLMSQAMGCEAYQQKQRDVCQCVKKDMETSSNREQLLHLLKVVKAKAKDRTEHALDQLLQKYEGKEPTMFFRLLKKYPDALQVDKSKTCVMDTVLEVLKTAVPTSDASSESSSSSAEEDKTQNFASFKKKDTFAVGLEEADDEAESTASFGSSAKKDKFVVGLKEEDEEEEILLEDDNGADKKQEKHEEL